jgi:hypothetical protein
MSITFIPSDARSYKRRGILGTERAAEILKREEFESGLASGRMRRR